MKSMTSSFEQATEAVLKYVQKQMREPACMNLSAFQGQSRRPITRHQPLFHHGPSIPRKIGKGLEYKRRSTLRKVQEVATSVDPCVKEGSRAIQLATSTVARGP